MKIKKYGMILAAIALALTARASDKYWYGSGTWTSGAGGNWSATSGSGYGSAAWNAGDNAIFEGTAGTVTLGSDISLVGMTFAVYGYTISGNTLNFQAGGWITNKVESGYGDTQPVLTITSAITGSPTVWAAAGTGGGPSYNWMKFAPAVGNVTLGKVSLGYADGNGGDKGWLWLSGTTAGNSVSEVVDLGGYSYVKQDSGSWTYGKMTLGAVSVLGGDMILNGTVKTTYTGVNLSGGTLHYNVPGAIDTSSRTFTITGGNLNNTSGAALIVTNNPTMTWGGNFGFTGSNGTNSDLHLGTGIVNLTAIRTVTVSNALTTLTVGGVIANTGGIIKAGAGTLKLTALNTYSGPTAVSDGRLIIEANSPYAGATTVTNGTLVGLVGYSYSNSAVTVTNTGALAISVTNITQQWICGNLALDDGGQLKFSFNEKPIFTNAPLYITNTLSLSGNPLVVVDPVNLIDGETYPLLVVGGTPPTNVPAVNVPILTGKLKWGGPAGKTLLLTVPGKGTVITIR